MKINNGDESEPALSVAMIGKGWFPDEVGGLDRYFMHLFRELRSVQSISLRALVVGPASTAPTEVAVASTHTAPLLSRLIAGFRAARELKVDVVDAHFALYSFVPLRFTRLRRVPLIAHFHGPWADEGAAGGLTAAIKRRVERKVYRRASRCLTLSQAFRRVLIERYGVLPWRIDVEPPGVDLEQFSPGDRIAARSVHGVSADAFVACCVRRLVPRMGVEYLLEAWVDVTQRSGPEALLLIAGDGPCREGLEARADVLGLGSSVRFLSRVSDAALVELYRAADVNVVPSIAHEGFGLIVLEAAACGTPSVVTNVGGLPEAVYGLDPSLVVEPESAVALSDRVLAPLPSAAATVAFASGFAWPEVARRNIDHLRAATVQPKGPRRLRVVYLDHVAQMSGGEIALLRLLPHLRGVDAHVVLGEDGPFAAALGKAGISVEVLKMPASARDTRKDNVRPGRLSVRAVTGSVIYTLRLARRLRTLRPDIVHTNSLKAGVYGCVAARLARVPVVWHVRDRIASDYLPAAAVTLVQWMIPRFADGVIANSQATLATINSSMRATVAYSVVPEVIELTRKSSTRRPHGGALVFGMVGRIAPWKGQNIFLDAFARAFPDGDQRAVVVGAPMFGEEEDAFAELLVDQVERLGISKRVEFRGFRANIFRELAGFDVLVHASCTPEPFGQVVLEGMAAGIPVVAAGAGGPLELISDGVDGLLYAPGDADELAMLLGELARDDQRRSSIGRAARARARDFTPAEVAKRVEELYHATVKDARRG
jgi:glycosyltransferase involved in cell wall biosynthesis